MQAHVRVHVTVEAGMRVNSQERSRNLLMAYTGMLITSTVYVRAGVSVTIIFQLICTREKSFPFGEETSPRFNLRLNLLIIRNKKRRVKVRGGGGEIIVHLPANTLN